MCGLPHRREGNIHCLKPSQAPGPINPGKSLVSVPQHTYVRGMATSKGNLKTFQRYIHWLLR